MQLTLYKRTVTRFIADDKVVYQGVRRATWLASDNSWARRTSFEVFEREIVVNYSVQHTWTGMPANCTRWLVHLACPLDQIQLLEILGMSWNLIAPPGCRCSMIDKNQLTIQAQCLAVFQWRPDGHWHVSPCKHYWNFVKMCPENLFGWICGHPHRA